MFLGKWRDVWVNRGDGKYDFIFRSRDEEET